MFSQGVSAHKPSKAKQTCLYSNWTNNKIWSMPRESRVYCNNDIWHMSDKLYITWCRRLNKCFWADVLVVDSVNYIFCWFYKSHSITHNTGRLQLPWPDMREWLSDEIREYFSCRWVKQGLWSTQVVNGSPAVDTYSIGFNWMFWFVPWHHHPNIRQMDFMCARFARRWDYCEKLLYLRSFTHCDREQWSWWGEGLQLRGLC